MVLFSRYANLRFIYNDLFIHSSIYSFIHHSFIHSFIHSLIICSTSIPKKYIPISRFNIRLSSHLYRSLVPWTLNQRRRSIRVRGRNEKGDPVAMSTKTEISISFYLSLYTPTTPFASLFPSGLPPPTHPIHNAILTLQHYTHFKVPQMQVRIV